MLPTLPLSINMQTTWQCQLAITSLDNNTPDHELSLITNSLSALSGNLKIFEGISQLQVTARVLRRQSPEPRIAVVSLSPLSFPSVSDWPCYQFLGLDQWRNQCCRLIIFRICPSPWIRHLCVKVIIILRLRGGE